MQGKVIKDKVWVAARVGPDKEALHWRQTHLKYFLSPDEQIEEKVIDRMTRAWPQEVRVPERWDAQ
ncbi:hypothetical protein NL533_30670, partial [Klebsiella pneumoniae]|nr:hypothetical protein [Klebsiella pneumoniae]